MQRSIWKGVIAFGMVSIPVKLYAASGAKDVALHLLHKECGSRLKELRWCPVHEQEVPWDDISRGYEYAKGYFVVLTDEELERLPVPSKHTIALTAFISAPEVDPLYFQKGYYLEPDQMGVKPYALLTRALTEKGLVALATITIRTRERLCVLRPKNGALVLETLYYADEVRLPTPLDLPKVEISQPELAMAASLIELLSARFEPEHYDDRYRAALMTLIEAKLQGKEVLEVAPSPPTKVVDLMAALKASVEQAQKGKERAAGEGEGGRRRRAS